MGLFHCPCLEGCIGLPCCNLLALEMYRPMQLRRLWIKFSPRCARQLQPSLMSGMCGTGWHGWTHKLFLSWCLGWTPVPNFLSCGNLGSNFLFREPRVQLPFPGTSGPTSFPGNFGSNFLPRKTSPGLTSASRAIFHFISRGMFRERLHVGPSRARLFLMTMLVIPSRLP